MSVFLYEQPLTLGDFVSLQEQHGNDDTDLQLMKTHMETLLDTLRDIAQVNTDPVHLVTVKQTQYCSN